MSETPPSTPVQPPEVELARERTKQVVAVGWTVGIAAFLAVGALATNPTWPVAVGIAAVAAMVAFVCHNAIRRPGTRL